jgi:hypothetical protein
MSDRGSVALKNVRAAEGLVDMIQTTRDFRSDLGGGGWSILWRNEDADRWASSLSKKLKLNTKSHFDMIGRKELIGMTTLEVQFGLISRLSPFRPAESFR